MPLPQVGVVDGLMTTFLDVDSVVVEQIVPMTRFTIRSSQIPWAARAASATLQGKNIKPLDVPRKQQLQKLWKIAICTLLGISTMNSHFQ